MAVSPPRLMVVWCPDWPVLAAAPRTGGPVAVVRDELVEVCSAQARAEGVRRGQRIRRARLRCPGLRVLPRDEEREARLFERVVAVLEGFVPAIEVVRPGLCAFTVRGPARYFGGEEALAARITEAVGAALDTGSGGAADGPAGHVPCRVGVAEGLFAGELAARSGTLVAPGATAAFLADRPAAVLARPDLVDLLARLGIRTLGDYAALPAAEVQNRFGAEGAAAHRLARGLEPRPLDPRGERPDLAVEQGFDPPETSADPLVFAAKALADRLHAKLTEAGLVCGRVAVEASSADGRRLSRLWRHEGLLTAPAVAERVRWQLQAWADTGAWDAAPDGSGASRRTRTAERDGAPEGDGTAEEDGGADPSGPPGARGGGSDAGSGGGPAADRGIVRLRLAPDQLSPDTGQQLALWGESVAEQRVARAAARVQALLGHHAVQRVESSGGRGPAERTRRIAFGDTGGDAPARAAGPDAPWPGRLPDPAPATVPRGPAAVEVRDAEGRPVEVSGRAVVSAPPATVTAPAGAGTAAYGPVPITGWTGPWPAVDHWWDPARHRRRARFQVTTADGRALLLTVEGSRWWVEAVYG